ncbi:MAG: HAD-IIIA family hydrolase [Gammaproteobacteria bacterium]|nr:HAD-IIIA family hydrolase [Gammaproteobacteria bacterium]
MPRPAVFLDKDGTLLEDLPFDADPAHMRWAPRAREGVAILGGLGCPLVVVSNQPGVALGRVPRSALASVERRLREMFAQCGAALAAFRFCPHAPAVPAACGCRKPQSGLLLAAARELGLDLADSWMVGDILDDIEAGRRAGCRRTVLIDAGRETRWELRPLRIPHFVVADLAEAARLIAAAPLRAPA